jgi:hypothetical protein
MFTYHSNAERAAAHQQALRQEAANERRCAAQHQEPQASRRVPRTALNERVHALSLWLTTVLRVG